MLVCAVMPASDSLAVALRALFGSANSPTLMMKRGSEVVSRAGACTRASVAAADVLTFGGGAVFSRVGAELPPRGDAASLVAAGLRMALAAGAAGTAEGRAGKTQSEDLPVAARPDPFAGAPEAAFAGDAAVDAAEDAAEEAAEEVANFAGAEAGEEAGEDAVEATGDDAAGSAGEDADEEAVEDAAAETGAGGAEAAGAATAGAALGDGLAISRVRPATTPRASFILVEPSGSCCAVGSDTATATIALTINRFKATISANRRLRGASRNNMA